MGQRRNGPKERKGRIQENLDEVGGHNVLPGRRTGLLGPLTSGQEEIGFYELSGPWQARQSAASEPPVLAPRWGQADALTGFRI